MLGLLEKYARDENLAPEPGFKPKIVKWAIVFDERGQYTGVVPCGDKEKKEGLEFSRCPDLGQPEMKAGGVTKSHFLVETAEVVALHFGEKSDQEKVAKKHGYFCQLLSKAANAMPELGLVHTALQQASVRHLILTDLQKQKAQPNDKVTFAISGGNGDVSYPVSSVAWHNWWRKERREIATLKGKGGKGTGGQSGEHKPMRSFITGALEAPCLTHEKIEGLRSVGGGQANDVLVGFKQPSFCSYGLSQSENAAMSEKSAKAYVVALNYLIKNHSQDLAGAKVVHWFKARVPAKDDPLAWLSALESDSIEKLTAQQRAKELLEAVRTGSRPDLRGNHFYALTISGAGGRVMVRDWMEGQFEELVASVESWFSDLAITNYKATNLASTPGIERIITCLLPPKKPKQEYKDWVKPLGAERLHLWLAAVRRDPIPTSAIARLVGLNAKFMISGELDEASKDLGQEHERALAISLIQARMALIKCYHLRKERRGGTTMGDSIQAYLNEDHPHPAYHCGRLMAVLAKLQVAALGDVGAGVIQRYYAAASCTPALVLGRLVRGGQFHLGKLDGGLAHYYEERLKDVWTKIKENPPKVLTLEEQSLFAMGYYQQLASMWPKKKGDQLNQNGGEA